MLLIIPEHQRGLHTGEASEACHGCTPSAAFDTRRCSKGVDLVLDGYPKLVAIDEEADHQIVHRRCFGKTNRTTYETLDSCPQIDVVTLDFLCILLPNLMLLWVNVPLVRSPSVGVKSRDPKGLQEGLQFKTDGILATSKNIRQHGPTRVIDGMP